MNSEISLPTNQITNPNLPLNVPLNIPSGSNSKVWDADQFRRDVIKILTTPSINVNHKPSFKRMSAENSGFLLKNDNKSITAQRSKSDDTKHQQKDRNPNQDGQSVSTKKPLHSFTITKYSRPLNEANKEEKTLPLKRKVKVTPPLHTKKLKLSDQSTPPKSLKKRRHPRKAKEAVLTNVIDLSSPEKSPQMKVEGKKTAVDEGTPVSTTTENASEWIIELEISPIKESLSGSDEKQHDSKEEILPITSSCTDEKSNNSSQNDNKEEGSTFLFEEGYEMMIECYSEEDDFINIHQVMKNKKEYKMIQGNYIEDAENIEKIVDPVESEIRTEGGDYQAEIPSLRMKKYKKPVKLIWSPDMVPKGDLERYTEKISKLFRVASDRLNHEILIEILLQNGLHIENAIECVKRNLDVVRREVVLRNRNSV